MMTSDEIRKEFSKYRFVYDISRELNDYLSEREKALKGDKQAEAMMKIHFNTLYTSLKCETREGHLKWDELTHLMDLAGQIKD